MKLMPLITAIGLQLCDTSVASAVKEIVQFPGAYHTFANAIDDGIVVGSYQASANSPYHGFIYDGTTYTTLDVPGSVWTELHGIDGNHIVGTYLAPDRFHGLLYDGVAFKTIDPPDATNDIANGTVAIGIDGDRIVGQYWKGTNQNGFVLDGSSYSAFNYPSGDLHSARDVEGNTIVGTYFAALGIAATYTTVKALKTWTILLVLPAHTQPAFPETKSSVLITPRSRGDTQTLTGSFINRGSTPHGIYRRTWEITL